MSKHTPSFLISGLLPWDALPGERRRQWIIILVLLLLALLVMVIVENTEIPKKDPRQEAEIPERLAKLVMERKEEPPPPPEPEPEPEEEPEPEPEPEPEEPEPEPEKEEVEKAREVAKKELEVFQESLAGLQDLAPLTNQPLRTGGAESAKVERNLITSRAGSGSGGVAVSSVSSGGGGSGNLESGTLVAEVESDIASEAATTVRKTREGKSVRTDEQIRRTFDRSGGRINSAYQRALRSNPALRGSIVLTLTIDPSGKVSDVKVKSSELNDPELERRIVLIVTGMDFGALPVEVWKGDYTLNLFPS